MACPGLRFSSRGLPCASIITTEGYRLQGEPLLKKHVLFIHGAGEGAFEEDGLLVASLQNALQGMLPYLPKAERKLISSRVVGGKLLFKH